MGAVERPEPRDALQVLFAQAGVSPDEAATEVLAADLARLRGLVATVHAVAEADVLDGVLTFDPTR